MQYFNGNRRLHLYILAAIIFLYAVLVIPMVSQVGISFDEQVDLTISKSYGSGSLGMLRGIDLDSTNVRLPMYISSFFLNLTDNQLQSARLVSCLMGALTLLAVFLYCRREFDQITGLVACFILSLSPYFLAFSKIAFTEGDIFITCFTVWLLYSVSVLKEKQNLLWSIATGLFLGLALGAKASASALVVATVIVLLLPNTQGKHAGNDLQLSLKRGLLLLSAMTVVLLVVVGGWYLSGATNIKQLPISYSSLSNNQITVHYLASLLSWVFALSLLYRNRNRYTGRIWSILFVLSLAATTFFILPPVHTANPAIFAALVDIFTSSSDSFSWQFAGEAATLHFLTVFLKSGIVVGIGFWLSVIAAVWQCRRRSTLYAPLVFFFVYFAFLVLKMPHAQTFFMMTLLPIAAILLADRILWLWKRSRKVAWVVICCALLSSSYDLIRTYPFTHLNGYQWLGARYLAGRSTIGYRSVAQTPSDGLAQAASWIRSNVESGERLVYFIWAGHILNEHLKNTGIVYFNGFHHLSSLDQANYVLIHINATLDDGRGVHNPKGSVYKYPFNKEELERDFRKIYSEKRPFGIEVASVWYRNVPYEIDGSGNITGYKTKEDGLMFYQTIE